jgi:hypothetical protein
LFLAVRFLFRGVDQRNSTGATGPWIAPSLGGREADAAKVSHKDLR